MKAEPQILVVDDEAHLCANVQDILGAKGYSVDIAHNGEDAISLCQETGYDIAIVDVRLEDIQGPEVVKRIANISPSTAFIYMTGYASLDGAIEAVRQENIVSYETKPVNLDHLLSIIEQTVKRKRAEEALRESEQRYRSVVDNIGIGVGLISPDMEIVALNNQMKEWFPSIDETGKPICYRAFNNPPRDQVCDYCPTHKTFADGQCHEAVTSMPMGMDVKHYRIVSTPIMDDNSEIIAAIKMVEDISEKKRSEEERHRLETELRQAQKMEAIGTLAGGIAHDFNNILAAIMGYTEMAMENAPGAPLVQKDLTEVLKAGTRAKDLVYQILTFSRQTEQEAKPVKMKLVVKEAAKLLRASLPSTIEVLWNIQSESSVMADPTQIHQVVMNLCTNAAHAMEDKGGMLEVSLEDVLLDGDFAAHHPGLSSGLYTRLIVSDTGHGMDASTMSRIFEPYFTTKEKGEGTGLGLATVHGIVKSHGGAVTVYSEPGEGTTFHIYLPVAEWEAEAEVATEETLPTGSELVLLVDDEQPLVNLGKEMLESLGYGVVTRTSSLEALETFRKQPGRFDVVVTDMTMPSMTGDALAMELLKVRSDIPVVLCTGFSAKISEEKVKALGIRGFVMKPFLRSNMARTIRAALDETRSI